MIVDLTNIVNQNAEMCSSNSKDADGNIVSHKEILGKVEEAKEASTVGTAQAKKHAEEKVLEHNTSFNSHADIRATITTALEKAQEAYNLAAGKSKVHPMQKFEEFVKCAYEEPEKYNVGDVVVFIDKLLPDFVLFAKEVIFDSELDDYIIPKDDAYFNELDIDPAPGKSYLIGNMRFVTVESGMDTSGFAREEDVQNLEERLSSNEDSLTELGSYIEENVATKEEAKTLEEEIAKKDDRMAYYDTETSNIIELEDYAEYDLGQRLELTVELPEETGPLYCCIFNFYAGETPTSFDAPSEILFQGDDTLDGRLYPVSNRLYEINIKNVMGVLVAKVGANDYEVIE